MPMGASPLPAEAIDLLTRWVREGAADDTPPEARAPQAPAEPPTYTQAPTITGLTFSPDGEHLAVGGSQESLLHKADGSAIEARLLAGPQDSLDRFLAGRQAARGSRRDARSIRRAAGVEPRDTRARPPR